MAARGPCAAVGKIKRTAMVSPSTKVADMRIGGELMYGGLLSELKLLGYAEGENLIVERYSGRGTSGRLLIWLVKWLAQIQI